MGRPSFFWEDNFQLSRHEFQTRTTQTLTAQGHFGEGLDVLVEIAMEDYDEYWREFDANPV